MSAFKELLVHALHYFMGQALLMLAGLVSMPIMTRLLSKEEYGIMSLVFLTLTWLSTLARLGFTQSVTRFYAEYRQQGALWLQFFCSTMVMGACLTSLLVVLGTVAVSYWWETPEAPKSVMFYLRVSAGIVFLRVVLSIFQEIYRAEKQHFVYNAISIADRYCSLGIGILLYLLYHDIFCVFLGIMVTESLILLGTFYQHLSSKSVKIILPSWRMLLDANQYGLPLVFVGSFAFILDVGDRYVIQYLMDAEAVANYSVVYDASSYLGTFFLAPVRLSIMPIIFSMWATQGEQETAAFMTKVLRYVAFAIIPAIFGFALLGKPLLTLLASAKYAASSPLIPYIFAGVLLGEIDFLLSSGLRTQKKTLLLAGITLSACLVNVVLNIIFVPLYGLQSAAVLTLVTYALKASLSYIISVKHLHVDLPWRELVKATAASLLMTAMLYSLGSLSASLLVDVLAKVLLGALCYGVIICLIDAEIKAYVVSYAYRR